MLKDKDLSKNLIKFDNFEDLRKSINKLADNYELSCLKIVDLGEVQNDEDFEEDTRLSL